MLEFTAWRCPDCFRTAAREPSVQRRVVNFHTDRSSRGPRKTPGVLIKAGSFIKQPRICLRGVRICKKCQITKPPKYIPLQQQCNKNVLRRVRCFAFLIVCMSVALHFDIFLQDRARPPKTYSMCLHGLAESVERGRGPPRILCVLGVAQVQKGGARQQCPCSSDGPRRLCLTCWSRQGRSWCEVSVPPSRPESWEQGVSARPRRS
jgi:hypothetical protein